MHCIAALDRIKITSVSVVRCPVSVLRPRCEKTSNGHISATRHPIYFVFGSRLGFLARIALFNLTAHELHDFCYDMACFLERRLNMYLVQCKNSSSSSSLNINFSDSLL